MTRLKAILFPEKDRAFRGERALRMTVRTAHLAAMGILLGGHVFDLPAEKLFPAMLWTVVTGAAYALIELYCSFNWLFQIRGLMTLAKIGLVLLVPVFWDQRVWILLVILAIGSVGTHMQANVRYYSILTKAVGAHKKG